MPILLLLSCAANILALYEAEKADVLADVGPPAADWQPDFRLRVAPASLEPLVEAAIEQGLDGSKKAIRAKGPLGLRGALTPVVHVKSLSLTAAEGCGGCLAIDADLAGKGRWELGPAEGTTPFTAQLTGTLSFRVDEQGGGWVVAGHVEAIDRVVLGSAAFGKLDIGDGLQRWIEDAARRADPVALGELGGAGAEGPGLRALRLDVAGDALEIQGLLDVVGGGAVAGSTDPLATGWELRLSQRSALALMRKAAFERGLLDHDVAVDPRSLEVHGGRFAMDLRLWRLSGSGWWRDYQVDGTLAVGGGKLHMKATDATERDKSKGAGIADPIALLAEGRILEAVTAGCRAALPAQRSTRVAGVAAQLTTSSVAGVGDAVVLTGGLYEKR